MRVASLACALLGSLPALPAQSTLEREPIRLSRDEAHRTRCEQAAQAGLRYLKQTQEPTGCWTGHVGHKRGDDYLLFITAEQQQQRSQGHLGVTSLAGLAFLAGGHLPGRGEYGEVIQRTIDYVLANVEESGFATDSGTRMYSHAFATLFLAQVYGMAQDPKVKHSLDRAVQWIVDNQNQQGAWRYNPFTREADLSVTVCQLQSLRAARNIGIRVPRGTIDRAVDYVNRSRTPTGRSAGLFYYKIAGRGAYNKNHQYAINAAAVTSLFSAGVHDQELVEPALTFLEAEYPYVQMHYADHYYFWYGNYYASQAFFQSGGDRFDRYFARISQDLLRNQRTDGGWSNYVGPGDAFSTAVASMILQIPMQYLPIFQR